MRAAEALVAWNPESDEVEVGPLIHPGRRDWTEPYDFTGGAAYAHRRELTGWEAVAFVFIEFHTLVVGDGVDANAAHREFLKIDEYRDRISPDILGASSNEGADPCR